MKEKYTYPLYSLAVILLLLLAGCLKPPTDEYAPQVTTSVTHTPIPQDMTCSIYSKNAAFAYNGFSFSFNQKNPPMFINYTVIPKNVTVNKVYTDSFSKKTVTKTYSDYSTSSWLEVTIRNNATKEILVQDGFGAAKGYSTYLSRTIKVIKSGDLLVEIKGNDITASVTIWAKPHGNFDESRMSEFTDCMNWEGNRDTLATQVPTTIEGAVYTWTPENQIHG
jgi:hypothetical protein